MATVGRKKRFVKNKWAHLREYAVLCVQYALRQSYNRKQTNKKKFPNHFSLIRFTIAIKEILWLGKFYKKMAKMTASTAAWLFNFLIILIRFS